MHRIPARILATLLLLSLTAVPPAFARRADGPRPAPAAASSGAPIAFAPMFVPTPPLKLMAAEELAISRSTLDLVPFRLANGTVRLDLLGRFQEFALVRVGADGKLSFHCVDDADVLRRLLSTPVSPAPGVLEDR